MSNGMHSRPAQSRRLYRLLAAGFIACAASVAFGGCGGSSQAAVEAPSAEVAEQEAALPPVAPEALTEFETGMRWMRASNRRKSARGRRQALDKAQTAFRQAVAIDANLWEAWFNLGTIAYSDGDDEAAVTAYGQVLSVKPDHTPSLAARAEAYRRSGNASAARDDYRKAVESAPEDSEFRRAATARLASILREAGSYDEALAVIRETLRTSGASADVYVELGILYMAQDRDELAELVLRKASELDPNAPAVYNTLALLALGRGQSQQAFEYFDRATALDPNYLDARFNKASVLLDAGDYARAKDELQAIVGANPEDMHAQVALGVALRGMGEYKQAKRVWQRVVDEAPRRSRVRGDALFDLAMLEMRFLEDDTAARTAFEQFLDEAPRNHPKREAATEAQKELSL